MPYPSVNNGAAQSGRYFISNRTPTRDLPTLTQERAWRQPAGALDDLPVVACRWLDGRSTARQERREGPVDRYVLGVALRPVRARIGPRESPTFEGVLSAGTIHLTAPGRVAEAEFLSPCDFVHFYVRASHFREWLSAAWLRTPDHTAAATATTSLHDLLLRDELAGHLSRTLIGPLGCIGPHYAESVGRTISLRLLATREPAPRVGALPKWRMRRVQDHMAAHLADRIRLSDLAQAAGLSRMHFAAQFKVATGCSPHEYVLQHRVEAAKAMLLQTNLPLVQIAFSTGFQTQSHFSGVFKKLVGEPPARWQRSQCHT